MTADKQHIFFLGIGGIGMSALARYFHQSGYNISGYDRDKTTLTKKLEELGIRIQYQFDKSLLIDPIDIVIYTPAIKTDQEEYQYFLNSGVRMLKRSEALMNELETKKVIAIAGTHGKTSTSAILAHILQFNDCEVTSFIGGVMNNYNSNFIFGKSDWVIVEADEYDRSFWRLYPAIAVIQAMDADHLDIYGTEEDMVDAYRVFTLQIKDEGHLFVENDVMQMRLNESWKHDLAIRNINISTFGLRDRRMPIVTLEEMDGKSVFYLKEGGERFELSLPGAHNVQNSLAAIVVARKLGLSDEVIADALATFSGIERRFQYLLKNESAIIIDDYAHHPKEIDAAISAAKVHHPGRALTVVFQPHLYSRTRDFMRDFAVALGNADEIILVELYPARERPIEGVDSEKLLSLIEKENKAFVLKKNLVEYLGSEKRSLILLLGAGDVYKLNADLIEEYNK